MKLPFVPSPSYYPEERGSGGENGSSFLPLNTQWHDNAESSLFRFLFTGSPSFPVLIFQSTSFFGDARSSVPRLCESASNIPPAFLFALVPFFFPHGVHAILLCAIPEASVKTKRIPSRNKETLADVKRRLDRSASCWSPSAFSLSFCLSLCAFQISLVLPPCRPSSVKFCI